MTDDISFLFYILFDEKKKERQRGGVGSRFSEARVLRVSNKSGGGDGGEGGKEEEEEEDANIIRKATTANYSFPHEKSNNLEDLKQTERWW